VIDGVQLAPDNSWRRYTEEEVSKPGEMPACDTSPVAVLGG
jgi:hypothetical protein